MNHGEESYRRFLQGDREAFSELIDKYNESLIFFIRRFVFDLNLAEDIAEDCFVALIIYPHRYNFKISLKTYLFTIARNKAVDYIRHHQIIKEISFEEAAEKSMEYLAFEEEVLREEKKRELHQALDMLREEFKAVLHLIYFEEMSYEDAGRVMRKSRKQIENLAYRARKELRAVLLEKGWNYEE